MRLDAASARAAAGGRVDLGGAPPGALALWLTRLYEETRRPQLIVTHDGESAERLAASLRFFSSRSDRGGTEREVLVYPATDTTPYTDVAPDRRATMARLATLFHLSSSLPWRFLVVAAPSRVRRVPPRDAIAGRSMIVRAEGELDREELIRVLGEGGYLRVPVVEDPGTFAVRGAIVDIYPPHSPKPARIELDDYLVMSIKPFDPDDQRTEEGIPELFIHPVRDALLGAEELERAKRKVRALCDAIDMPSTRTRQLIEDLDSGRASIGFEGLLPAFYEGLGALDDYLPEDLQHVIVDPTAVARALDEERALAEGELAAKRSDGAPTFEMAAHYVDEETLAARMAKGRLCVVHTLAVGGGLSEDEVGGAFRAFEAVEPEEVLHLGAEDQSALSRELQAERTRGEKTHALAPLGRHVREWLEAGLRVVITARTMTQAERLVALLRGYEVPVVGKPEPFDVRRLSARPTGKAEVVTGGLSAGFVVASEAVACVTEEEIFGARASKRQGGARKKKRDTAAPFVEDLRQLEVGDYVVHVDHGIGKYLGLERKSLAQTKLEELRGVPPITVEVLVVEYTGGDKLYLPVTRLNQIQKFAGQEAQAPKLDRLGGQTFARTKSKVKKAVQALADELLKLYAQRAAHERDPLPPPDGTFSEFEATFPFDETPDQARAIEEVLSDLEHRRPMDRVVCGDVGFGKTEVALRAAFRVALAGKQVAVLCPTTVLAQQHYQTFRDRLRDYPVNVAVLSRFVTAEEQTKVLGALKEGKVDILVGTHRILSKDVHFKQLGLLVIDEEQRFGVVHKERIKQLKSEVDVLTLSATPIPRTLQMAVGGLRDLSLIATAPVDRRAVRTFVTRWNDQTIKDAIQRELTRGGQVFFVYNRIEGLYERAQRLQELVPNARFAVGHGQMNEGALERVMTDFVEGRYDVLCSTAIIESGLDIPRANTMLIDRADTFGLAQLYQLRGRVGRSKERAYCYLIAPPPSQMTDDARARIEALQRFTELGSGFQVASLDMELRGAGDLLGTEQSGSVASVGFELFVRMLEEAVSELRGEPIVHEVDTELTLDLAQYLPESYVDDVGVRLSLYKRFASAEDEEAVSELAAEMEDRFGAPPPEAAQFVRAMRLKPGLRSFRVLGCEATRERVTLHLREDTLLDPVKVMALVAAPRSLWKLSPDMKLTRRYPPDGAGDAIDRVESLLKELEGLRKDG